MTELVGARVFLRPLQAADWEVWREVRVRCRDWLERWEPIAELGSADPALANVWALPLALLLLGLAYERWVCMRAAMQLSIRSPSPWHLAQSGVVHWHVRHDLSRPLTLMVAPALPCRWMSVCSAI